MKKIISLTMAILMLASLLTGCGSAGSKSDVYNIGIIQLVTHDALDAATQGFMDAVKEELGEENVKFDLQNAAGDTNTCATIVNSFVSNNVDLIMANATPALQAASAATPSIIGKYVSITNAIFSLLLIAGTLVFS